MKFLIEDMGHRFGELKDITYKYAGYEIVKPIPFSYTFDMVLREKYEKYFPLSASIAVMLLCKDIGTNVFFSADRYNYLEFQKQYGDDFINTDLTTIKFKDLLDLNDPAYFIKASGAPNILKGKVYSTGEYDLLYQTYLNRSLGKYKVTDDYPLVISSVKDVEIASEYRFFVINGEIITGSMYLHKGKLWTKNIDNINDPLSMRLLQYAYRMVDKYWPDKAFVIDIAVMEDGAMKVLECNCIHCSGLYAVDIDRLVKKLVQTF